MLNLSVFFQFLVSASATPFKYVYYHCFMKVNNATIHCFAEKELITPPTPPLGIILPGITRKSLIDLAKEKVCERDIRDYNTALTCVIQIATLQ